MRKNTNPAPLPRPKSLKAQLDDALATSVDRGNALLVKDDTIAGLRDRLNERGETINRQTKDIERLTRQRDEATITAEHLRTENARLIGYIQRVHDAEGRSGGERPKVQQGTDGAAVDRRSYDRTVRCTDILR